MNEAKCNACRFQMTGKFADKESGFIFNSECIIEQLRECRGQGSQE